MLSSFVFLAMSAPLLSVNQLSVAFQTTRGLLHAVNDVSFSLQEGETLGIVGESGSGKSVTCSAIMGLLPEANARILGGEVIFGGHNLLTWESTLWQRIRGNKMAYIFQDPMTTLNPYLTIGYQIMEPLLIHRNISSKEAKKAAIEAMEEVGISHAASRFNSFPHEFSGGMRQRVVIAMALITRPSLLIADEPTTALDVTVQKQVLDLIKQRQAELGTSIILITHDLGVVARYTDRIQVMYAGRAIESAPAKELINSPRHAYTQALLRSRPQGAAKDKPLLSIPGLPPDLHIVPQGCAFSPRNILGDASRCLTQEVPSFIEITPQHFVQNCPGCVRRI